MRSIRRGRDCPCGRRAHVGTGQVLAGLLVAALLWVAPGQEGRAQQVGGPFSLVDQSGNQVADTDYRGSYMLVQFGYTFCPDICPTELQDLSLTLDLLGPAAKQVVPLFITIDPERDTPDVLEAYVSHFNPQIVGLTGSPEQVASLAQAYQVYVAKVGDGEDYLIDHSAVTYLMGPDGAYITHFPRKATAEDMAAGIGNILGAATQ